MPIFGSLLALIGVVLIIFILKLINFFIGSIVLEGIINLIWNNMLLLLFISLITTYANYFSKFNLTLGVIAPLLSTVAGIMIIYFIVQIMDLVNKFLNLEAIAMISSFVNDYFTVIFIGLLVVSYIGYLIEIGKKAR